MPIASSDIHFCYTGGSSNTSPSLSLGGAISNTEIPNSKLNNIFDDLTPCNTAQSEVFTDRTEEYRIIAIKIDNPLADSSSDTLHTAILSLITSDLDSNHLQAYSPGANTLFDLSTSQFSLPTYSNHPAIFQDFPLTLPSALVKGDQVHIALKHTVSATNNKKLTNTTLQIQGTSP